MEKSRKKSRWVLPLVIMAKSSKLIKVFKILKLFKFSKALITLFTMAFSALVYSFAYGPWFAIGLVVMLFVHEMGHVIAMNQKGYTTSAPVFIPMLGAVIFAPQFKTQEDEAYIGYGGPLLGGLGALLVFIIWLALPGRHEVLLLTSFIGTYINLFNLLPIRPMDGGRVTHLIGSWFKWIGLTGVVVLILIVREPAILLILILTLDDINLKPSFKFGIGLVCLVAMTTLMLTGHSEQVWWANLIDVAAGSGIVALLYGRMRKYIPTEQEDSTPAPLEVKIKWLVLYLLLAVGLTCLILWQIPYLPQALRK